MNVGIAGAEIAFPQEVFPNPREEYTGVHDNPLAHALILEAGERFCFLFADLADPGDWNALREEAAGLAGIDKERVLLHISHDLATPHCTKPDEEGSGKEHNRNALQKETIAKALREATLKALKNIEPVLAAVTYADCKITANRVIETAEGFAQGINPEGETTSEVPLVCFRDLQGKIKGVLYFVDTSPAVLENSRCSDGRRLISGDIASASERLLKEELKAEAVYVASATGDQWPRLRALRDRLDDKGILQTEDLHEEGFTYVDKLAAELSDAVSKAALGAVFRPVDSEAELKRLDLSLPGHLRLPMSEVRKISRTVEFTPGEDVETSVWALTLEDTAVLAYQQEICVATKKHICENSPYKHTLLMAFTNGLKDYMVTADLYKKAAPQCKKGLFAEGAAEQFEKEILNYLGR